MAWGLGRVEVGVVVGLGVRRGLGWVGLGWVGVGSGVGWDSVGVGVGVGLSLGWN